MPQKKKKQVLNCKFSELPRISTIVVNKTRNTSGLENILNGYARIGVLCAGQSEQEQKNAPVASKELFKRFSKESKDATFGAVNANQEIDELLEKWNDPMLKKLLLMYKICEWKVFEGNDNRYRQKFLDAVRKEVGNHLRKFPDTYRKFWVDNPSVRGDLDAFLNKPSNSIPSDNLIRKFFYGKALGGRFNNYTSALPSSQYEEWDATLLRNPETAQRDAERFVRDKITKKIYYTGDHYSVFIRIE